MLQALGFEPIFVNQFRCFLGMPLLESPLMVVSLKLLGSLDLSIKVILLHLLSMLWQPRALVICWPMPFMRSSAWYFFTMSTIQLVNVHFPDDSFLNFIEDEENIANALQCLDIFFPYFRIYYIIAQNPFLSTIFFANPSLIVVVWMEMGPTW